MNEYALTYSVEYPDRDLNRLTTAFRIFTGIPIAIVLGTLQAANYGILFPSALLMILFRKKYPRWWFDWNRELVRFTVRVQTYFALMNDRYPSSLCDFVVGVHRWGLRVVAYACLLVTDEYPPFSVEEEQRPTDAQAA